MAIQHAVLYLDPGSGSLLFQLLLSGLLTLLVFFKKGMHLIRSAFVYIKMHIIPPKKKDNP